MDHKCINEERLKGLEEKMTPREIIIIILTPKMVIAICLGVSLILQTLKGV